MVGDAHDLSGLAEEDFDFAFSVEVFEHLLMPWKVAIELNRHLLPGALVFTQTTQSWPIHDEPWDFWRFSRESWAAILNARTGYKIVQTAYFEPHVMMTVHQRGHSATLHGEALGFGGVR